MKAGHLIAAAIEMVIKVVVIAAAIIFIFRGATGAYEFGYRVFADEPMSVAGGRTITVGISEAMKIKDIAKMLEEKGLIEDANLFIVQELLSAHHNEIVPGIYDLSTSMTAQEMIAVMSAPSGEEEEDGEGGES
ncbi:MAG: aminodeoxychorismate lyase [Lachnospiraceae bacterium]|nr:aminodeoxychorismate lyase [Lachnospiraceae bacterium]MDE7009477.1 aminodeoxychorismate lyase [Lachnospiraceae bacterium]